MPALVEKVVDTAGVIQRDQSGNPRLTVLLGTPRVRYAGGVAETSLPHHDWVQCRDSEQLWSDGHIRLNARWDLQQNGSAVSQGMLAITVMALSPVRVASCAVDLNFPGDSVPWFIDRFLQWRPLQRHARLNDLTHLCVRWKGRGGIDCELRTTAPGIACELFWEGRELRVRLSLDAAALHPRWRFTPEGNVSFAAPEWKSGDSMAVEVYLATGDATTGLPAVASRFPRGTEAGFVLTDHCDFDSTDRLRIFLHGDEQTRGWLGRGLAMTKGVFTLPSHPDNRPPAASLGSPEYKTLIQELHRDGSEIAPHALNESNNISASLFHETLLDCAREWSPSTWIDHGCTLHYLYAMGGGDNPQYKLVENLRVNGFTTLWAYQDVPTNACRTLNLASPDVSDFGAMTSWMVGHFLRGEFLVGLHYGRSMIHRYLSHPRWRVLKVIMGSFRGTLLKWHRTGRIQLADITSTLDWVYRSFRGSGKGQRPSDPYTQRELLKMAPSLYPERAVPLHQCKKDDMMLFMTNEVTHTCDVYTRKSLGRLIEERGLHIGHTYLLNHLPYIAGIFSNEKKQVRLSSQWTSFLDNLTEAVLSGILWNPTAGALSQWVKALQDVRCIPVGPYSMEIQNRSERSLPDFTLLLPLSILPERLVWGGENPKGWRSWSEWRAVWGDLPPESRTIVEWRPESHTGMNNLEQESPRRHHP